MIKTPEFWQVIQSLHKAYKSLKINLISFTKLMKVFQVMKEV